MDDDEHMIDLARVWAALDDVRECGAISVAATFLTGHGLVCVACGPSGRALSVNGERVALDGDVS